jgi:hypothetical protein
MSVLPTLLNKHYGTDIYSHELGISQPEKTILWSDNQAAIAISHSPEFHARMKHINIALHFIRDYVEAGKLEIKYVPSRDNLADIFTKGLA